MPVFEIERDGKVYDVEAPDAETAFRDFDDWHMSTFEDVARSGVRGLAEAVSGVVGLPGDIGQGMDWLARKAVYGIDDFFTGPPDNEEILHRRQTEARPDLFDYVDSSGIHSGLSKATGGFTAHEPRTMAGDYTRAGVAGLASAAAFGGSGAGNLVRYGLAPAVVGETAAQGMEAIGKEEYAPAARLGAGLATSLAPDILRWMLRPKDGLMRTAAVPKRDQAQVDYLKSEGVEVTPGQYFKKEGFRSFEGHNAPDEYAAFTAEQAKAFTRAAARKTGVAVDDLLPDNMDTIRRTIGEKFDDVMTGVDIPPSQKLADDLSAVLDDYTQNVSQGARKARIANEIDDLAPMIDGQRVVRGPISSRKYQSVRRKLGEIAFGKDVDYENFVAATGIIEALDDAFNAALKVTNPDAASKLTEARRQWRNYLVLKKAMSYTGVNSLEGQINPSQLRRAMEQVEGYNAKVFGSSDYDELIRSGSRFLTGFRDSGTARNLAAQKGGIAYGLGGLAGAGIGGAIDLATGATGGPTIIGALLGQGASKVPSAVARFALSKPGRELIMGPGKITHPGLLAVLAARQKEVD